MDVRSFIYYYYSIFSLNSLLVKKCTPQEAQNTIEKKRSHIIMKDKHFRAMYRYYDKHVKGQRGQKKDAIQEGMEQNDLS